MWYVGKEEEQMASKMAPDLLNQIVKEFQGGETLNRLASVIGE